MGSLGGASHVSDTGGLLVILRLDGGLAAPLVDNALTLFIHRQALAYIDFAENHGLVHAVPNDLRLNGIKHSLSTLYVQCMHNTSIMNQITYPCMHALKQL